MNPIKPLSPKLAQLTTMQPIKIQAVQITQPAQHCTATASQNQLQDQNLNPDIEILNRLTLIEQELIRSNPNIKDHLRLIHRTMLNDPSQVTLLSTEQRSIFFRGLMKQAGIESLTTEMKKKSNKPQKSSAELDLNDLI